MANAQFGPPGGGGGGSGNPFGGGEGPPSGDNPFSGGGFRFFESHRITIISAHAICATLAFAFLFPVGGIMIRLASFRGLWLVHGLFQIFAYILFIAAAGLGLFMVHEIPPQAHVWSYAHPIIGLVLLAVLFFQPWSGLLHHLGFKRDPRRGFFSYAHIWIGRIAIILGIINGGLGLQLSRFYGIVPASNGVVAGYSVGAAIMFLLYFFSIVVGETRRRRARRAAPLHHKRERYDGSREQVRYA